MQDFCPILGFDHLEFYVGNARQAASFYSKCFGFRTIAYRGLETGSRAVASYVVEQGNIRFVLSSGLSSAHAISKSVAQHGDNVGVLALQVPDVVSAYKETTSRGAVAAIAPTEVEDGYGILRYAAIHIYGDVLLKFVDRSDYAGSFAPTFQPRYEGKPEFAGGLRAIDHVVGNVGSGGMEYWVNFFEKTMGFNLLVHFDENAISTEYSALMSKVMRSSTGTIKLPINEPAKGKHKSQIEEYLEYNEGAGVQHIALATDNMIETVRNLKAAGVEFLQTPRNYYDHVEERVGTINEPLEQLAELGILIDRDQDGYLLQIFTQPVQDRPTLFFEVIQRQGAQGFGEGNFRALFEAIEREQALRGNL